jgi:glycosyltransferase involved in cell wall biosynthesis
VSHAESLGATGKVSRLAAIVLAHNEERNLPSCLGSLAGLAGEIVVVDSGSQDGTAAVIERFGGLRRDHPFVSHAAQWQWALSQVPDGCDWVLALDADQRLTPELEREIRVRLLPPGPGEVSGFFLNRRQVFRGRWIRFGGYYPKYLLKLFRKDRVAVPQGDLVDHHFRVEGRTENLRFDLIESNLKENEISFWIEKHNRYARLQAREELARRSSGGVQARGGWGSPDDRILMLKGVWARLPRYIRPALYFVYRYVIRLGFLDGKEGFIFHFLQAYWYRLLVDINLEELVNQSADGHAEGPNDLAGRTHS